MDKKAVETNQAIATFMGERMRMRRKKCNLTLAQVADKLNLSTQMVQKYETGEAFIHVTKLVELAQVLQTATTFFYEGLEQNLKEKLDVDFSQSPRKDFNILIKCDDLKKMNLFDKSLKNCSMLTHAIRATNHQEIIEILKNNSYKQYSSIDLVIIYFDTIDATNFDLLRYIKRDRDLMRLPVVMVSGMSINVLTNETLKIIYDYQGIFLFSDNDEILINKISNTLNYFSEIVNLPNRFLGEMTASAPRNQMAPSMPHINTRFIPMGECIKNFSKDH